jgi:hypothetical protein
VLAGVHTVPNVIWYRLDVGMHRGVARRSETTAVIMFVAAISEVALRFVCIPTGMRPKTAIKQKAPTPRATVNSTSENADINDFFTVCKFLHCRRSH